MANELIEWSEIDHRIAEAKDFETIAQLQGQIEVIDALAKQRRESLQVRNRIEAYRMELSWAAADLYKELPESAGRRRRGDTTATAKQDALQKVSVSKATMNRWVDALDIPNRQQNVAQYEAQCNERNENMTFRGFVNFADRIELKKPVAPSYRTITVKIVEGEVAEIHGIPQYVKIRVSDDDLGEVQIWGKDGKEK